MCGIAGIVQRKADPDRGDVLGEMLNALKHRGPDGTGDWITTTKDWKIQFGHKRLSIIDLETGGQPLGAQDGRQITFNGEIFNFLELRPKLYELGYQFKTRSDTEVLLHHLDAHSSEPLRGLEHLNAMFAFAYWDPKTEELLLARDHAGIKPLYYHRTASGGLVFSSELTSLIQHPEVPRNISTDSLKGYFFADYFHPSETVLKDVFKLLPGHFVVWRDGNLSKPIPFWKLENSQIESETNEEILQERLRHYLEQAVSKQLVSDVPVGIFLSGGIDSSIVAALSKKLRPNQAIKTFSIAFEEPDYDESIFAQQMADQLKTEHVVETMNQGLLLDSLDPALASLDEPMADPSVLPTYVLCRLAARYVKVVLGGDGGDELWAGYPTYKAHELAKIYGKSPRIFRKSLVPSLVSRLPVNHSYQSFEWKAKRFTQRWDDDVVRRHLRWMSSTDLPQLNQCFISGIKEPSILNQKVLSFSEVGNSLLALDFTTYMSGSVLTKVDRASMAHGLEVRPPFLDTNLISWAFSLPYHWKRRSGESKFLLKSSFRGLVPDTILLRKKKGFGIPLARWLKGPLKSRLAQIFESSPVWEIADLSPNGFRSCFERFISNKEDHSRTLWALLVLDHWMRRHRVSHGG